MLKAIPNTHCITVNGIPIWSIRDIMCTGIAFHDITGLHTMKMLEQHLGLGRFGMIHSTGTTTLNVSGMFQTKEKIKMKYLRLIK